MRELDHKEGSAESIIDAFKLWCWKKLLRVPWTGTRIKPVNPKGNQLWLFTGRTDAEADARILSLATWFEEPTHWEKTLMLGKVEGKRRRQQRMRWLDSITDSMDMNLSKLLDIVKGREAWQASVHGVTKSWTWLTNWTTWLLFRKYASKKKSEVPKKKKNRILCLAKLSFKSEGENGGISSPVDLSPENS